ncbi:equilibrative nucleoside transporter [Blyttiomyces helicus]|uniref:Equilibrative nucleoside transporter n=1 Tax=Blyttiomyces helicus TaxID=388810 RepID=A0A4P9WM85_9FUNG|nr:equilibrative nucleoside transporter [Blyttiomyces helicus]|eukprot:RKO94181.1 equilibrative nucleoside transporter [Blyttiomyces helicus]
MHYTRPAPHCADVLVPLPFTRNEVHGTFGSTDWNFSAQSLPAASYPPTYIAAVSSGQGLAGLIPSLVQILLWAYSSSKDSLASQPASNSTGTTVIYFLSSVGLTFLGLLFYCTLHFVDGAAQVHAAEGYDPVQEGGVEVESGDEDEDDKAVREGQATTAAHVFPHIRGYVGSVFFAFCVTLAVYPGITSSVAPVDPTPVLSGLFVKLHFVVFNAFDWLGKSLPAHPSLAWTTPKPLHTLTLARFVFAPLLLLCNVVFFDRTGERLPRTLPLALGDSAFFALVALLAFSNGWLGSNLMMLAPREVAPRGRGAVGNVMVTALTAGLAAGSLLSFGVRGALCGCNPFSS